MALTAAEKRSLYDMLAVPVSDSGVETDGYEYIDRIYPIDNDWAEIKTWVDARIAALAADDETRVKALVVQWDVVADSVVTINGAVGAVQGVQYDPAAKRQRLREQVQLYIPLLHHMDIARKRRGGDRPGGGICQVIR